jgi:hypothetical protein
MKNLFQIRLIALFAICMLFLCNCTQNLTDVRNDATKLINQKKYKEAKELLSQITLKKPQWKQPPYITDSTLYFYKDLSIRDTFYYFTNRVSGYIFTSSSNGSNSSLFYYNQNSYSGYDLVPAYARDKNYEDLFSTNKCFYGIHNPEDSLAINETVWERELRKTLSWKNIKGVEPNFSYFYLLLSQLSINEHDLTKADAYLDTALYYFPEFSEAVASKMLVRIIQNKWDNAYTIGSDLLNKNICRMYAKGTSLIYQNIGYLFTIKGDTINSSKQFVYAHLYNKDSEDTELFIKRIDSLRAIKDWK